MCYRKTWLGYLIGWVILSCQHTPDEGYDLQDGKCLEPQFEMKYVFGSVMPEYLDLGIDMRRLPEPFTAQFAENDNRPTLKITIDSKRRGLLATIWGRTANGDLQKQGQGFIVDRHGKNQPFMLVIETRTNSDGTQEVAVKAREMSDQNNRGIIDKTVTGVMPTTNPEHLIVSGHHRGLIVTEGTHVREFYHMTSGRHADKVVSPAQFQDIAESYLDCERLQRLPQDQESP